MIFVLSRLLLFMLPFIAVGAEIETFLGEFATFIYVILLFVIFFVIVTWK